jgi:hypothetical protein
MSSQENSFVFLDDDGIIGWWLKQLKEASGDYFYQIWSSYPEGMKKIVANILKLAAQDITQAQFNDVDINELAELGGAARFFDAILESVRWPDNYKTPKNQFKRNFRACIVDTFRGQVKPMTLQPPPKPEKKIRNLVKDETIERLGPFVKRKTVGK